MSIVTLVSGGLDSTIMAILAQEEGLLQFPLFINYGQLNLNKELNACLNNFRRYNLPTPDIMNLNGYGALITSGLTNSNKHIFNDAFLPCRNLIFLTVGAAYAHQHGAGGIAIGLLDEAFSLFPDQTKGFVRETEALLSRCLGYPVNILTPLMSFSKAEVIKIAKTKNINGTYSCHAGTDTPCGVCVACREFIDSEV